MSDTIIVSQSDTDTVLMDAAPGPPGRSITVHWSTELPGPTDGQVGDLWVVTE